MTESSYYRSRVWILGSFSPFCNQLPDIFGKKHPAVFCLSFSLQHGCVKTHCTAGITNQCLWNVGCSSLRMETSCLAHNRKQTRDPQALKALILLISERWEVSYTGTLPEIGMQRGHTPHVQSINHLSPENPKLLHSSVPISLSTALYRDAEAEAKSEDTSPKATHDLEKLTDSAGGRICSRAGRHSGRSCATTSSTRSLMPGDRRALGAGAGTPPVLEENRNMEKRWQVHPSSLHFWPPRSERRAHGERQTTFRLGTLDAKAPSNRTAAPFGRDRTLPWRAGRWDTAGST